MNQNDVLISRIQQSLRLLGIPGWLFYGFHAVDPIALSILRFPPHPHISRRWFYLVPAEGEATKLVHRIEPAQLDHLPGKKLFYHRWGEIQESLQGMLKPFPSVAMQYSERNSIPYVSKVDAGTVDFVRSTGTDVVTSADLIQVFQAVLTPEQQSQHRKTAGQLTQIAQATLRWVAENLSESSKVDEASVQNFVYEKFRAAGLETEHPPIVGVNQHSADPHYGPTAETSRPIERDDFLLIDIFARPAGTENAVYSDITWTALYGRKREDEIRPVFEAVRNARDRGVDFLNERLREGVEVEGWEVDEAVRGVMVDAGFEEYILHRTGHNLGVEIHGSGVNFDNLETHDTRKIIPGLTCTIEPGLYLPAFGVRSEINILIQERGVEVTTTPQKDMLLFDI